ncbi:proton channel OtopLc-like [Centruroides vittatus]|uniref:proton channel OtopLc-like n=1 Tax=Centruroides vittatus TaxID=120091 RepID=UPI0035102725
MTAETSKGRVLVVPYDSEENAYDNPALSTEGSEETEKKSDVDRYGTDSGYDRTDRNVFDCTATASPVSLTPKLLSRQCHAALPPWYRQRNSTPSTSSVGGDLAVDDKDRLLRKNLTCLFSFMYAIFVVVLGGIIYMYNNEGRRHVNEMFSSCVACVGMSWLLFLHFDLNRYKRQIIKEMGSFEDACCENVDRISANTEFVFNFSPPTTKHSSYRFLQGRHSGSFYLKCGMAAFCFGHLIHEGLQLGQQIPHFMGPQLQRLNCSQVTAVVLHVVRPVYSFYQLFMLFKYSNIVINRHKALARFGLMHVIATCLCFWFNTIVEDTHEYYQHKQTLKYGLRINASLLDISSEVLENTTDHEKTIFCAGKTVLSTWALQASPYLYPFTIEFNLLLAGVWIVMWQNIGLETSRAKPHPFHAKVSTGTDGAEDVTYHSNLVISADCHASNKGLFAGLFVLLITIVSVIIFFVSAYSEGYRGTAVAIHTTQEVALITLTLLAVVVAYWQVSKLDFNPHPITFLDDLLLFLPVPFFFVNCILSMLAEFSVENYLRTSVHLLIMLHVIVQTPLVVDGLRRCSNTQSLRYKKPGREIVTFLIICNLTMWIVGTFEIRSVEPFYNQGSFYGELQWLLIGHATLPLMLFYRFHSSVCLVDIWKSGYEKAE